MEVVAAEPTDADRAVIARTKQAEPEAVHVVKVKLKEKPPVTSMGWRLYVGDVLIPQYWEYADGIYFTVLDLQFFADHKGKQLRFSHDGIEFFNTGVKLAAPPKAAEAKVKRKTKRKPKAARLPSQADVLK
ncbi:MAG TPA: hypothetical protein VIX89_20520 [Bryobacteraceae bacterium]